MLPVPRQVWLGRSSHFPSNCASYETHSPAFVMANVSHPWPQDLEMEMTYTPSQQGSRRSERPQDASRSSEISNSKKHLRVKPSYAVAKLDDKDNAGYVAGWKQRLHQLLPLTSVAAIATYLLYVSYRVMCTVAAQAVNHTIYPVAWTFLCIESGVACEPSKIPRISFRRFC